jgi:hypothetical protein
MPMNRGAGLVGADADRIRDCADERERIWFIWTATMAVRPYRGRACEARSTR